MKHRAGTSPHDLGVPLTNAQDEQLDAFEDLLRTHAIPGGLVARSDADRLWLRHVADALRGAPLLGRATTALDLGSGAGLPGIPLAIARPDVDWVLLEPRRHRVAFLELVKRELALANVRVEPARASAVQPGSTEAVVARAFADPSTTWRTAEPLLRPGGRFLLWLGASSALSGALSTARLVASPVAEMGPIAIMTRQ